MLSAVAVNPPGSQAPLAPAHSSSPLLSPGPAPPPPATAPHHRHTARLIIFGLLAACLAGSVWNILANPVLQLDFHLLYAAAESWAHGENPYAPDTHGHLLGVPSDMTYVYPPDTLWLFRAFNAMPLRTAGAVFLGLKLGLAGWLFFLWTRDFLDANDRRNPWFAAFCLFGLGNTFLIDLRAGNISVIEQAFLWTGLAAYLRGRTTAFCIWLLLAAGCKLTLLAFSVLLLLDGPTGRHPLKFIWLWTAMAARLALDSLASPALFGEYVRAVTTLASHAEGSLANPASLDFLRDLLRFNLGDEGLQDRPFLLPLLYALTISAVGVFAWRGWQALRRQPAHHRREILGVCLACLTYALTVPRLKDYSCILLLVPVWLALKTSLTGHRDAWLAVIVFACLAAHSPFTSLTAVYAFIWHYQVLAVVFAAWTLLLWHLRSSPPQLRRLKDRDRLSPAVPDISACSLPHN